MIVTYYRRISRFFVCKRWRIFIPFAFLEVYHSSSSKKHREAIHKWLKTLADFFLSVYKRVTFFLPLSPKQLLVGSRCHKHLLLLQRNGCV